MADYHNTTEQLSPFFQEDLDIDYEMDKIIEETKRMDTFVSTVNDQTGKEIVRLEKVLETFSLDPQHDSYSLIDRRMHKGSRRKTLKKNLQKLNKLTKRLLGKKIQKRNTCLLQTEMSQPLVEMQVDNYLLNPLSDQSTPTLGDTGAPDIDIYGTIETESIISEPIYKDGEGRMNYVKYRLMNSLSLRASGCLDDKESIDATGFPLFSKKQKYKMDSHDDAVDCSIVSHTYNKN